MIFSGFGALFAGVAALAAIFTAWLARQSLQAAMEDSAERSRPVVVAELVPNPLMDDRMNFAVINYGTGVAHNVRVTFEPDPLIIEGDPREARVARVLVDRWAQALKVLPPGGQRRNVYYLMHPDSGENREPLPDSFKVNVAYDALRGGKQHTYCDVFELDMKFWQGETRSVVSTPNSEEKRRTAALEAIARGVGRYS